MKKISVVNLDPIETTTYLQKHLPSVRKSSISIGMKWVKNDG